MNREPAFPTAMVPSTFKSGTLSLDEYTARRDLTTAQQVAMLKESEEYKAHIARRPPPHNWLKRLALVALAVGLAAYFLAWSMPSPYAPAPSPRLKEPDNVTSFWRRFTDLPFLPVSHDAAPEASWAPAPSIHMADRADEAGREAELRRLKSSKEALTLERDALRSSSAGLKQEIGRQAAVIARLQGEAAQLTSRERRLQRNLDEARHHAAAQPSPAAPGSSPEELGPAALWAAAFGALLLFGLLPLLLRLRHTKHRLHQLTALYRATLAEVDEARGELADLQQLLSSHEARARDAETLVGEREGELQGLEVSMAELRTQSTQLQEANQELSAAKERVEERLQAALVLPEPSPVFQEATNTPASGKLPLAAEFRTPQPTENMCSNGQQPFAEPGSPGNAEEVTSQVFWPDIEFQDLSDRTRRGLASIKRRMHKAGYTKTRQRPDPSTPKTPEEYWTGMAELREQAQVLRASNESLEAQLDQVTGSLEDMMRRNDAAQRMCRARDQVIEELELMLARKVEDGGLAEAELATLRGVADECLQWLEGCAQPPPASMLDRLRAALAGQAAEEHSGSGNDEAESEI